MRAIMKNMNNSRTNQKLRSIGAVIESLRGVYPTLSHSTLRFFEREGLVIPARTPGGHRLYSAADIERIHDIKRWQQDRLSLNEIHERLQHRDRFEQLGDLSARFLNQALDGQGSAAVSGLLEADTLGVSLARLLNDVLRPALVAVGDGWAEGSISVAQEKEVSELARTILAELTQRHVVVREDGPVVLAACLEGERHELGIRMVLALLAAQGWNIHFLGADVAPRFIGEAIRLRQPDDVLLSVTLEKHLSALPPTVSEIKEAAAEAGMPNILVGGAAAALHPDEIRALGAHPIVHATVDQNLATITSR
jgi:MerR family transcriptional regulator, light-induced transcriptional regulator